MTNKPSNKRPKKHRNKLPYDATLLEEEVDIYLSTLKQLRLEGIELAAKMKVMGDDLDAELALFQEETGISCECKQCSTFGDT